MSYGNVRDVGVIEAYYVDPECPDDMYMTPDSKFWASCASQKSKASFITTVIAIVIILIIMLTVLYLLGGSGWYSGIAVFIGLAIIGFSAFNMLTAGRVAETMHREAMMSLATTWGMDYNNSFEEKNGRRIWKQDALEKFNKIREERRQQIIAEKAVASQINMTQGGPGGSAAQSATFGSKVGEKVGEGLGDLFKGFASQWTSKSNP